MSYESIENMNGNVLFKQFIEMVKTNEKQPLLMQTNKEFYMRYQHYYNELLNRLEK